MDEGFVIAPHKGMDVVRGEKAIAREKLEYLYVAVGAIGDGRLAVLVKNGIAVPAGVSCFLRSGRIHR